MQKILWHIFFFLVFTGSIWQSSFAQTTEEQQLQYLTYLAIEDSISIDYLLHNDSLFNARNKFPSHSNQKDAYWLKLDFTPYKENLLKDSIYILKTVKFFEASYFYQSQGKISNANFGYFNEKGSANTKSIKGAIYFKKEHLIHGHLLYLKIKRYTPNYNINNLKITFQSEATFNFNRRYYTQEEMIKSAPVYLFLGASGFIILFAFITFCSTKKFDFLFYALYVFCLVIYLGKSAFGIQEYINSQYTLIGMWSHSFLQILINLFYVLFAKKYLATKKNYPKLNTAIRIVTWILIGFLLIESTTILTLQFEVHHHIMNLHRLVMSIFAIASVVYLFIYAKNTLAYIIVVGSLTFTAGALAMLFTLEKNYMILGAVVESFLFGMGLSYKMRINSREKRRLKQIAFDDRISALKAQMNPHFIFNSLSSIQHLITSNKKEAAIKYLNKFSSLMRNLLEGSIEAKIILSEEISLLKKYLELEALRFDNTFQFNISVAEDIDIEAIEMPALLVQPFVENAILHGLLKKKEGNKQLDVRFNRDKKYILCEIEDNGIGRVASAKLRTQLKNSKKSRGIEVTQQRLQLLNHNEINNIEITDKLDIQGQVSGTLVRIKILIE